ncbi:MAG: N-acetyltransferase [Coprobacter sp.]|nr:N-acetyltransferase [Coprobacter sp.]
MEYEVIHNAGIQRFEMQVEGYVAYLEYELIEHYMDITHTWVPHPVSGRRIASALTEAALQYAVTNNLRVIPSCAYVDAYMKHRAAVSK